MLYQKQDRLSSASNRHSELGQTLSRIEIPADFLEKIGPEVKMDCHWIDIRLKDGRVVTNLVVRGGRFITGHASAFNDESELSFSAADIRNVKRRALMGNFWPLW